MEGVSFKKLQQPTVEVFCCYAREDQDLMKTLRKHLMPLQRSKLITIWSDIDINAGDDWEKEIEKHLDSAHIILLLVSADFIASDYCYSKEMERALERHKKNEASVIPIILRHTAWKGTPIGKLQALPRDARPVTDRRSWNSDDEALNDVVEQISPIVIELLLPLYVETASQLTQNRQQEDALAIYNRALELNPEYVPALNGKGNAHLQLGQYEESVNAFDSAIQVAPDDAETRYYYYGKANALRELHRYDESLQAYDEAIRRNPKRARMHKEKADLLLQLNRYTQALEVFEQLIKLDPENSIYYEEKGDILLNLNRFYEALEIYAQAVFLSRTGGSTTRYLAKVLHKKGKLALRLRRYDEATEDFKEAISLYPENVLNYQYMGRALLEMRRYREALEAYEHCIELSEKRDPYQYYYKGKALFGLERYEEALDAYDEAIRLSDVEVDPQFYHDKAATLERLAAQASELEQQAWTHWKRGDGFFLRKDLGFGFERRNITLLVGHATNPGIKRQHRPNEDSLFALQGTINSQGLQFGLFVVADGIGGQETNTRFISRQGQQRWEIGKQSYGQDASRLAIQTIVDYLVPKISVGDTITDDESCIALLTSGVQRANQAIHQRNLEERTNMGTTMTAALIIGAIAYIANVGDSRTYLYREQEGGLRKITQDHSVVASLVEAGIIKPDDIYTHPKREQIYRWLGEKPVVEVDGFTIPLQSGDRLLLCSDGLWDMVRDPEIQRVLAVPTANPAQTGRNLIQAALAGGGEDNVSVIVVYIAEATPGHTGRAGIQLLAKPETVMMPDLPSM